MFSVALVGFARWQAKNRRFLGLFLVRGHFPPQKRSDNTT
jgi:hypothetical protein